MVKAISVLIVSVVLFLGVQAKAFCFEEAGEMYEIPPQILEAISKVESNHNNEAINWNSNGTFDFCHMQINSAWYQTLGHDKWMSIAYPCECTKIGAEILKKCIDRYGYKWEAIGCYNARSTSKRVIYAQKVYKALKEIGRNK